MPIEQRAQEVTDADRQVPVKVRAILLGQTASTAGTSVEQALRDLINWSKAGGNESAIITRAKVARELLAEFQQKNVLGSHYAQVGVVGAFDTVLANISRNASNPQDVPVAEDDGLTPEQKEVLNGGSAPKPQTSTTPAPQNKTNTTTTTKPATGEAPTSSGSSTSAGSGGAAPTPSAPGAPSSPSSDGAPGPDASDEEVEAYIREHYGYMAWALDHEELGPLLRDAIAGQWTPEKLTAEIRGTDWWKENEAASRNFDRLLGEDPGSVEADITTKMLDVKLAAARLGITVDDERLRQMATDAIRYNWTDNELGQALFAEAEYNPETGIASGDIGAQQQKFIQTAKDWYVDISDEAAYDWALKVQSGKATEHDFQVYIKDQAISRFPTLKPYFDMGITTANFFEPYKNTIASMLEMPSQQVDLMTDPRFARVMDFQTENGLNRPMRLYELQDYIRTLPEWQRTDTAIQQASSLSHRILNTFGAI